MYPRLLSVSLLPTTHHDYLNFVVEVVNIFELTLIQLTSYYG